VSFLKQTSSSGNAQVQCRNDAALREKHWQNTPHLTLHAREEQQKGIRSHAGAHERAKKPHSFDSDEDETQPKVRGHHVEDNGPRVCIAKARHDGMGVKQMLAEPTEAQYLSSR
jgi:hypothetical protein